MADTSLPLDASELERRLRAAATRLDHPPTPDLAAWWRTRSATSTARVDVAPDHDIALSAAPPPAPRPLDVLPAPMRRTWSRETAKLAAGLLAFAALAALLALVFRPSGDDTPGGVPPLASPTATATQGPPPYKQTAEAQDQEQQQTAEAGPQPTKPPAPTMPTSCPPWAQAYIYVPTYGVGTPMFRGFTEHTSAAVWSTSGTLYELYSGAGDVDPRQGVIYARARHDPCADATPPPGADFAAYPAPERHGALTIYAVNGNEVWFFAADGTRGRFDVTTDAYLPPAPADATPVPAPTVPPPADATPPPTPRAGAACDIRYDAPPVAPAISLDAAIVAARASFPPGSAGATWPDDAIAALYGRVTDGGQPGELVWILYFGGLGPDTVTPTVSPGVLTFVLIDAQTGTRVGGCPLNQGSGSTPPAPTGEIAYVSDPDGDGLANILVSAADDSSTRDLTPAGYHAQQPVWSPNGQQLAFMGYGPDTRGDADIMVEAADGTQLRDVSNRPQLDRNPVWSPDGTHIAFEGLVGDNPKAEEAHIFVVDADGGNLRDITPSDMSGEWPTWSPDSRRLAFVGVRARGDGASHIWEINADGSGLRQLTDGASATYPQWSPADNEIIYERDNYSGPDIEVVDADSGDARVVATNGRYPQWASAGIRATYLATDANGVTAINLIVVPTGSRSVIAVGLWGIIVRAWSPDAAWLAVTYDPSGVTSTSSPSLTVVLISADGSVIRQLASDATNSTTLSWQPVQDGP